MPLSTTSSSPPLTPLPSDLSDVGSLSDSDWCDIASSGRGDSDSQTNADGSDVEPNAVQYSLEQDSGALGLHLGVAEPQLPAERDDDALAGSSLSEAISPESSVLFAATTDAADVIPDTAVVTASVATIGAASHALETEVPLPVQHALRLEFPDPLSSTEDMRAVMVDSTSTISTWPDAQRRPVDGDIPMPKHAHLRIVVLGHRPSPMRTLRVVSLFVDAVADALGVPSSSHSSTRQFGSRELLFSDKNTGEKHVYRILVSDDASEEDMTPADKTLAIVFFSATHILSSIPMLQRLPKDTLVVPLLHNPAGAFTPSLLQTRIRSSRSVSVSDDSWSAPSSVESSILVSSQSQDALGLQQRVRVDAELMSLGIEVTRLVDVWPEQGGQHLVVPLNLLDRCSVFRGVQASVFPELAVEVEAAKDPEELPLEVANNPTHKATRVPRIQISHEHRWGAFAVLSVILAALGAHVFRATPTTGSVYKDVNAVASVTPTSTPTPAVVATFETPVPPSTPSQQKDSMSNSLRNFALAVIANTEEAFSMPQADSQHQAACPSSSSPVKQTAADAPAATGTPAAPLTIDPPSLKQGLMAFGGFFLPGPVASTSKQPDTGSDYDTVAAAADALLSVVQRRIENVKTEMCLGETESALGCMAKRHARATENARKIGRAAIEAAPDIADRILARHRRARRNARKVRDSVTSVAEHVADWTSAFGEQMANRRTERMKRWASRRERREQARKQQQERVEATLCRSKLLCSLLGGNHAPADV